MYQACYLLTLSRRIATLQGRNCPIDVGKAFDLVAGTSTGGLVAIALAAGVSMERVVELYRSQGKHIFPLQLLRAVPFIGTLIQLFGVGTKRGEQALRTALTNTFQARTVGQMYAERGIALLVPAVDLNRYSAVMFKTKHLDRSNGRDDLRTLVDICMATTAAPVLRMMAELTEPNGSDAKVVYIDGGLWANNPAIHAWVEAVEILRQRGEQHRPIQLFTLGNLPALGGEEKPQWIPRRLWLSRGALGWLGGLRALSASMNAQSVGYDYMARKLAELHVGNSVSGSFARRLPAQCPSFVLQRYLLNMDDARDVVLNALARQAASDVDYASAQRVHDIELQALHDAVAAAPDFAPPATASS